MTDINKQLADLEELRRNGSISEEEYRQGRAKIFAPNNNSNSLGMSENSYLMLMHLSQFAGFLFAGLGFIIPIIMWVVNKDKSEAVDKHGKNILNFSISYLIYGVTLGILCFILLIGIITAPIALLILVALIVLIILQFIFIIIAAVKANSNEFWEYPLSIPFFNVNY